MRDREMMSMSCRFAWLLILTSLGLGAGADATRAATALGTPTSGWRQVEGDGPAARWGHVSAFDPDRSRVIVFGGRGTASELGDVWEFSLRTETWRDITPSGTGPSPRFTAGAVADPPRQRLIIAGGHTGHETSDEVWALSLVANSWARLPSGPSARFDAAMAAGSEKAWVYGGFKNFAALQALGDLWELDLRSDTWRHLPAGSTPPAPRTNLAFGFDAPSNALYIFGGHDQHPAPLTDTWAYELTANRWMRLSPAGAFPDAVTHQAYAFDAVCRALWMMGGDKNDKQNVASTWALKLQPLSFVRIKPTVELPPRQHAAMAIDASGRLIVFGGMDGDRLLSDTWILERANRCP
jgi:Galactose oxidase, central domain